MTTSRAPALALAAFALASACVTPGPHAAAAPAIDDKTGARMVQVHNAWLRTLEMGPLAPGDEPPSPPQSDPAVVFVHGFGSRLEAWRMVQPEIAKTRRTLSFDQRGFGLSERADGAYGPESHADDVIAVMDAAHIDRAVLVGHSYGCGVVLRVALRHPERVAGVVLVSPFALDEQMGALFHWARVPGLGEAMFTSSFRGFPGEKYQLAFGPEDRARFVSVAALDEVEKIQSRPGTTWAALATIRGMDYASVENDYAKITVPVAVVWGEKDRVTPIKRLDDLAAKLPHAKFTRVPAVGHMPPWEKPDAVIDAIRAVSP